jgi:hypothetical protein
MDEDDRAQETGHAIAGRGGSAIDGARERGPERRQDRGAPSERDETRERRIESLSRGRRGLEDRGVHTGSRRAKEPRGAGDLVRRCERAVGMALLGSHCILEGNVIARSTAEHEASCGRSLRDEEEGEQQRSERRAMESVSHG